MKCGDLCDVGFFHEHSKHCENRETDTDSQGLNSQRKKEKTYQKRGLEEQFTVETDLENNMKKRRIEQRSNEKDSGKNYISEEEEASDSTLPLHISSESESEEHVIQLLDQLKVSDPDAGTNPLAVSSTNSFVKDAETKSTNLKFR